LVEIICPKCSTPLKMPNKNIYDAGCPNCGTQFRIRNGKTYEQSEIVNNILYSLTILFANIARENLENKSVYFSVFDNFVKTQSLTKSQFNDINKTFQNEYKTFFRQNYKKIISELKLSIDELFKTSNFSEQQEYENTLFSLLYKMANSTNEINKEQNKILTTFTNIFEFTEERISCITPPRQKLESNQEKRKPQYRRNFQQNYC